MPVEATIAYHGELRCAAVHGPSRVEIKTDAPVDNLGKGESFSPTDLVATALGTCMLTTMGIEAQKRNLDIDGATVNIVKHMVADPKRRISALPAIITIPKPVLSNEDRAALEEAAIGCPVNQSLDERIERTIDFRWLG